MMNETLNTSRKLEMSLILADVFLSELPKDTPFQAFELRLDFLSFVNREVVDWNPKWDSN